MNKYVELRKRHQKEVDEFPLYFAFSNEQFEKIIKELNLSNDSKSEQFYGKRLSKLSSVGGFLLKEDVPRLKEMMKRHEDEIEREIKSDKTGEGFVYQMFLYEMENHEYGYTGDPEDTLNALGYEWSDIEKDSKLMAGFVKAHNKIMK